MRSRPRWRYRYNVVVGFLLVLFFIFFVLLRVPCHFSLYYTKTRRPAAAPASCAVKNYYCYRVFFFYFFIIIIIIIVFYHHYPSLPYDLPCDRARSSGPVFEINSARYKTSKRVKRYRDALYKRYYFYYFFSPTSNLLYYKRCIGVGVPTDFRDENSMIIIRNVENTKINIWVIPSYRTVSRRIFDWGEVFFCK